MMPLGRQEPRETKVGLAEGFPFIFGLVTVSLWSELEAFIEDICVEILISRVELWETDAIAKLKAPVAEFVHLDLRERCAWAVQALQREVSIGARPGIASFEPLLNALKLRSQVTPDVRVSLIELAAVRNILVHRRGKIDPRFQKLCPWLRLCSGDVVRVRMDMIHEYSGATIAYAAALMCGVSADYSDPANRLEAIGKAATDIVTTNRSRRVGEDFLDASVPSCQ
jgi:hypothetical protein